MVFWRIDITPYFQNWVHKMVYTHCRKLGVDFTYPLSEQYYLFLQGR